MLELQVFGRDLSVSASGKRRSLGLRSLVLSLGLEALALPSPLLHGRIIHKILFDKRDLILLIINDFVV